VAIVNISVFPNLSARNEIEEHYSGKGLSSQGYIEEVPEVGMAGHISNFGIADLLEIVNFQ
jgi:hypothetical protein